MKKVLFDTNVIIDCVMDRNGNHLIAKKLLALVINKELEGYVTGHSLTDFFYITRKDLSLDLRRDILLMIVNNFTILLESEKSFSEVLSDPDFFDLEDGLQMQCAAEANLDYIITENIRDFEKSNVQVVTAEEFLEI